jgi:hypothetical protein
MMNLWVWVTAAQDWAVFAGVNRVRPRRFVAFLARVPSWTLRHDNEQRDD